MLRAAFWEFFSGMFFCLASSLVILGEPREKAIYWLLVAILAELYAIALKLDVTPRNAR